MDIYASKYINLKLNEEEKLAFEIPPAKVEGTADVLGLLGLSRDEAEQIKNSIVGLGAIVSLIKAKFLAVKAAAAAKTDSVLTEAKVKNPLV